MHFTRKIKFFSYKSTLIFLLFVYINQGSCQSYPGWFLNQIDINCGSTAVGFAERSFNKDTSAIKLAFSNACYKFAQHENMDIQVYQTHFTTGIGTAQMDNNCYIHFDSSIVEQFKRSLKILDILFNPNFLAVIIGKSECEGIIKNKITCDKETEPLWVKGEYNNDNEYFYAIGSAPEYYYEKSSWMEAENVAIKNLSSSCYTQIRSVQRKDIVIDEIKEQSYNVHLNRVQVVARWRDIKNKVFSVLVRVPKGKIYPN